LPVLTELPHSGSTTGAMDPGVVARDNQGQALASPGVVLTAGKAEFTAATSSLVWAVYCAEGVDRAATEPQLHLATSLVRGQCWLALPDYRCETWRWQALPAGETSNLDFDPLVSVNTAGRFYFAVAAYDGAELQLDGLEVDGQHPVDPVPPNDDDDLPPDGPEHIGAYLAQGYWDLELAEDTFSQLQANGVDTVIDYALFAPEDEYWRDNFERYLQLAADHEIGVAFSLQPYMESMRPETAGIYLESALAAVEQLQKYPQITAWYVHDEVLPEVAEDPANASYIITLEQMQQLSVGIKALDPARPQLSVWCMLPRFEDYHYLYQPYNAQHPPAWWDSETAYEQMLRDTLATSDIVMVDCYPVDPPWDDPRTPQQAVGDLVTRTQELKSPRQPLWFVFQAFSWRQYAPALTAAEFPTASQIEEMLGAAQVAGATSLVAYSWFDLAYPPENGTDLDARPQALDNMLAALSEISASGWPAASASPVVPTMAEPLAARPALHISPHAQH
jgi:hypothetical protein